MIVGFEPGCGGSVLMPYTQEKFGDLNLNLEFHIKCYHCQLVDFNNQDD
jgi:hypothetical protein